MNCRIWSRCVPLLLLVAAALLPLRAWAGPAAGYWWNPAEGGRGFVIEIQGTTMFMAGFLYDTGGNPTWVASTGPMTSATQYSGSLITYHGGQTLTGAYQPATQSTPALGTISLSFTSDTAGSASWTAGGTTVTVPIKRFDIVAGGSTAQQPLTNPQTGWWWNPSEGGRGFAVEVQGGQLYFAGYMYDASGNATWYLAAGPMTGSSLFTGQWQTLGGGQTLTGAYKPASVTNANAGAVTLQFSNNATATLTLPDGRQIPFSRFTFGVSAFTLQAFQPAASAPAQLLAISGTGIDPTQTLSITLSDASGYSVSIPAVTATSSLLEISVPPYLSAATNLFGSGTVSVQATQGTAKSNTLTGFQIQALPVATGTPGTGTLSLLRASLAEAQRMQTAIKGTPQDSPAIETALGVQVTNLQSLVTNVQAVVQNGTSFSLGTVGGVNINVTSANIGDVDSLILATLQSLVAPGPGAGKSASATPTTCTGVEAQALYNAMTSGSVGTDASAQAFVAAARNSTACQTSTAFLSTYNVVSGTAGTSLGITDQGNFGTGKLNALAGSVPTLATVMTNVSASMFLDSLVTLKDTLQQTAVKIGVALNSGLQQATLADLLTKTVGQFAQSVVAAFTVKNILAPPASSPSTGPLAGTWAGTFTVASPGACFPEFHTWTATITDVNGTLSGNWVADDGSTGVLSGIETGAAASWSTPGSSGIFVATSVNGNQMIGNFTSSVQCGTQGPKQGTFSGSKTSAGPQIDVPTNLPAGTYSLAISYSTVINGTTATGTAGPSTFTNTDPTSFASAVQASITQFNSPTCGSAVCTPTVTPFDGTKVKIVYTVSGPFASGTITFTLTKTG